MLRLLPLLTEEAAAKVHPRRDESDNTRVKMRALDAANATHA